MIDVTPQPSRRILVAYDGSDSSARALRFALGSMLGGEGEAWIVHAADSPRVVAEPRTEEAQSSEVEAIGQSLRGVQAHADPSGRRIHVWVREGRAADVIVQAATEVHADLIVVGTRGLRGASRLLLGSVSSEVLARAGRPVAIVP
ncbi:MAG TPA: universal stress protein [Thermoplasmata archaeon]|nr:universal stress protein [Thermoplasmata archaeon]